ncbi:MAG: outer membrane beta-barrel protein [Bacteroidota bacterium]
MKKLLIAVFALISIGASAQENSVLLYGNVNIRSSKGLDGTQSSTFIINPGIGYQFTKNLTAGINLGIDADKTETSGTSNNYNKNFIFSAGPFLRYTKPLNDLFSAYAQLNASYLSSTAKPYTGSEVKWNGFGTSLIPALSINVHNGLALNFNIGGIDFTSVGPKDGTSNINSFNLTFGQSVGIGIQKNFMCKKKK